MKHFLILFYARFLKILIQILMLSETTICFRFAKGFSKLRIFNAKVLSYSEFIQARNNVPGYRKFLDSKNFTKPTFTGFTPNIHEIPETDKENYVKLFSMDERCITGKIPTKGVVIDESSGSSGTATNWARGKKERVFNSKIIQFGTKKLFGNEPLFIINAFALGPWATGVNITMSCVGISKLKSIGPDKIKIINTLKQFGKNHKYVIMGYPPFLKSLVDNSELNWKEYNVSFVFGGESMSEGMREYLFQNGIKKTYSSFGASDLELNIAAENDFTISLRKLLQTNLQLRDKIIKHTGALPMIFQYNPADFFIETSENDELIITVCRPNYIAPKIRYNIHDKGHIISTKELFDIINELQIPTDILVQPKTDLPILLHYGRTDMTVSFFGANISPNDIQETIFSFPKLATTINSFCLATNEDSEGNKQLKIALEFNENSKLELLSQTDFQIDFFEQLAKINQDFREAKRMLTDSNQILISFFEFGTGVFKNNDIRIKTKYLC